jgi:phosphoglycolate phosphatase-like HAD superfamily hydrolase
LKKILNAPYTRGAIEFLRQNKDHYHLFIASGTPQEELQNIVNHRRLSYFFREVYGTPKQKDGIIADILNRHSFLKKEAVFVGDAESDRIAAEKAGIFFIARISSDNRELQDCRWQVKDLTELDTVLSSLSSVEIKGVDN